ncbi:MAG: CinA family nicotinamide mononucleotide deamidase-related protein [Saprospiraceae bacterium]|nr:CinA family nicotinamide mononucleotide deamidase-related protein [Saprospiraceae bacterium]
MQALLITIGDEILLGQTIDTNATWLGQELNLIGIQVARRITVGDELSVILDALSYGWTHYDLVIMTGGLGPTNDDITKKAIAHFFQVDMVFDQGTYERILRIFDRIGRPATEAHREQCYMPANAELLPNAMGTAPGMWFERDGHLLISLPGVPYEMKSIMTVSGLPRLKEQKGLIPIFHCTLQTAGLGESEIASRLEHVEAALPDHIKLAYLPSLGQVRLRLSAYGGKVEVREIEMDHFARMIHEALGQSIFAEGDTTLEAALGELLRSRALLLATAESCTGGAIAHHITSVPGSSQYYLGTLVAYHNALKIEKLGVSPTDLDIHGAVSEPVVRQMVQGAIQAFGADVAISASGVAGPSGGTPDKPVGMIWIAVGNDSEIRTRLLKLGKDRIKNIETTAVLAMNELRIWLLNHPEVKGKGILY